MRLRHFYLAFAFIGLILPYWQFVPWLIQHQGLSLPLFFQDLFANRISAFFAIDVIISAIVLLSFIQTEGKRLGIRLLWLPTVATLLVGVSLGLPLFLYQRQRILDQI